MTMLPDIDETTWDEYDRQRLAQELEQRQQQFALQQTLSDKIAAVGTIGAPEADPDLTSRLGGAPAVPPPPPPTLPPDEPALAPQPEPAAAAPPDVAPAPPDVAPAPPPPSLDMAPSPADVLPTPSAAPTPPTSSSPISPVSDWAANAFATGLNAVHQAGGDADAFAQNFTSSLDPGQLVANAMNAATSAGADVDQFLSNFRLPAQPQPTSTPSLTFLGEAAPGRGPGATSVGSVPDWLTTLIAKNAPSQLADDPDFIRTVAAGAKAESGWNPDRVQNGYQMGSGAGARGLFQFDMGGMGSGYREQDLLGQSGAELQASQIVPLYAKAYQSAPQGLTGAEKASWVAAQAERPRDFTNPDSAARRNYATAYNEIGEASAPGARESLARIGSGLEKNVGEDYVFPVANYQGQVQDHWGSVLGGSDLFAPRGTPVQAMRGGKVIESGWNDVGGNSVLIQGDDGLQYYYAHGNEAPAVKVGQTVGTGTYLMPVGDTGDAQGTGTHLHIGIGPDIKLGADKYGGTGGDYNAVGLLRNALAGKASREASPTDTASGPEAIAKPIGDFFSGLGSTAQDVLQAPVRHDRYIPAVPTDMLEDQSAAAAAPPVVQPPQSPVDRLKSAFSDFVDSIGGAKDQATQALSQVPDQASQALSQVPDVSAAGLVDIGSRPQTAQAAQDLVSSITPPIDTSTPLGRLRSGDSITDLTPAEQAQAFSDWNKTFVPGPASDVIGGVAPALRGGKAALDVIEQQRQDQLNRDLSNPAQLVPLPGGMSVPVFPDQVNAARRGDWGEFMQRTLELAGRAAGTGLGGADADASPWVSAGLTAAGVDPDSARVLGQVANLVGPVAFERALPEVIAASGRGVDATLQALERRFPAETAYASTRGGGELPFGIAGAQPQTGAGLLDNALGRLERTYPAEVASQIREWATATEGPASQIASTVERWMVDNPIATVAERPTARETAEIVQELETEFSRGRGPAAGGTRPEREQIPLFGDKGGYEVRMPEGEGGPGVPSTSDPQAQDWLQRLREAKTAKDFQSIAEDLQRSGLVGDRESTVTEGAQRVMPGFEEGRQPNLPEGTGGPGVPSTSDPAAEAWLQRLKEARTAEDFAALDRDLQRSGLAGDRATQQEGYLPGFEPLNKEVASGQHAELRNALEKLGLLGDQAAPTEKAIPPGLNYQRLAQIRKEGVNLELPNTPDQKTNLADRIIAFLNSNMLLTPHGLIMNFANQTEQTLRAPLIRALAGYPDEAVAGVKMLAAASGDGLRAMAKMLGTGRTSRWTEDAPGSKIHWEAPGLRANAGMDEGFRHVAGLQEMGMEAARLIGENRGQPVDQVLSENAARLRQASERGSAHSVFQDGPNTGLGGKISRLRSDLMNDPNWGKKLLGTLIYGAVPFSRVPEVVWNTGLRRLPAVNEAFGTAKFIQAYRNGDARGMRMTAAETGLDSAINLAIAGEALAGNITGKDDPEHPWSLRLPGDKWVDYRATGPLGLRMGAIASAVEAKQEDANKLKPEFLANTLDKTGSLLSNQWYLDSIVGTLSLIREGRLTDAASQFLTQSGDRLLPAGGALNYIEQSTDPLMRDPTKELPGALFERQESRMPIPAVTEAIKGATGLDLTSAQLPARVSTTTGEPVQRGARGWLEAASGIQSDVSDWGRKEIAELHRSGYTLNPPPEKVDSITVGGSEIPLNDDERRTYLRGRGEYIGKVAANLQTSASYRNASDNGKAEMWQKIMDNSADVGVKAVRDRLGPEEMARRRALGFRSTGRLEPRQPVSPGG